MARKHRKVPSYRLHKPTGQAVVRLDGRDHYLGKHGTDASHEAYRRVVAHWLEDATPTNPGTSSEVSPVRDLTVNELILRFWSGFVAIHYRHADGTPTGEQSNFRDSLRPLRRLYGLSPAREFGPAALKAVRRAMVEAGLARTTINQRIGRIVHLFKWAVENELLPAAVHQGLKAVSGLRKGRSEARETEPVRPVPEEAVEAIRHRVSAQVWAMIQLQRLTGMRPGEVCRMRGADLDMTASVWTYSPSRHKGAHRSQGRIIYLGPRAREVLRPWLREDQSAALFSPAEAVADRRARMRAARKSKVQPSQIDRAKAGARRRPHDQYTTCSYHHAIRRACEAAGIPPWHPHQLRHSAATELRRDFGLDVSRVILGHRSSTTTEIYAELDHRKAIDIVERIG